MPGSAPDSQSHNATDWVRGRAAMPRRQGTRLRGNQRARAAIPADHLRVLCDYDIRQRSQHFDHPFLSFEETSAIRYHRRAYGQPTHLVISAEISPYDGGWIRWNVVAEGIDSELKRNSTQSWGGASPSRKTGLRAVAA